MDKEQRFFAALRMTNGTRLAERDEANRPATTCPQIVMLSEAKHLEAKHLEAKHLEAKHLEAKHLEAKHLEAKHLEAKHLEAKHLNQPYGHL